MHGTNATPKCSTTNTYRRTLTKLYPLHGSTAMRRFGVPETKVKGPRSALAFVGVCVRAICVMCIAIEHIEIRNKSLKVSALKSAGRIPCRQNDQTKNSAYMLSSLVAGAVPPSECVCVACAHTVGVATRMYAAIRTYTMVWQ